MKLDKRWIIMAAANLWMFASGVQANIGDTYATSCKRYGTPAGSRDCLYTGLKEVVWYQNREGQSWTYAASFNGPDHRCDAIRYVCWGHMSDIDQQNLIEFNFVKGEKLQEILGTIGQTWTNQGRTQFAYLYTETAKNTQQRGVVVEITTVEYNHRARLAREAQEGTVEPSATPVPAIETLNSI